MIENLVRLYDEGAITAHHLAVESLHMLDPAAPELVLAPLPDEILHAIQQFAATYNPREMKTNYGVLPSQDQVDAATTWICEKNSEAARSE